MRTLFKFALKTRDESGLRMIEAEELRRLLAIAATPMKAMILLGLNCGYGQSDISSLPQRAIDLAGGWVTFPRPKTGVERRCPLWPETVKVLREAFAERPQPKNKADAGLAFLTRFGKPRCCGPAERRPRGRVGDFVWERPAET